MEACSILAWMLCRLSARLHHLFRHSPAVVLLGPRQAGKTTLALEIGEQRASVYLDLEDEDERAKLSNPTQYLADHESELVIMDEVHRVPELFQRLRGIIDRGRRSGKANGRFLLLGSAAMDLLKQTGESLDPQKRFVVYPGSERFPLDDITDAIGVVALAKALPSAT